MRLLLVHRWLGLTAGVLFAVAAGTGGVLVYMDDLDSLVRGPRFQTTPGLLGPGELQAAIERHAPGARVVSARWPAETNIFVVRVTGGTGTRDLVLDPGSGGLIRLRPMHPLLSAIRLLHINLFLGPMGARIVQLTSAVALVSLAAGLVLWWPGLRRLGSGFRVRLRGRAFVWNRDLHQTLGTLAFPVLMVMTATGILMNPAALNLLVRVVDGVEHVRTWSTLRSSPAGGPSDEIDLATAVRAAVANHGLTVTHVTFPASSDGIIQVGLVGTAGEIRGTAFRVALDRHTGDVLLRQQLSYDYETNRKLHFGRAGGPVVRALYTVSCFVGFALFPTGFAVWWLRRRPSDRTRLP